MSLQILEDRIVKLERQDQEIKSAINDDNQDLQDCMDMEVEMPRTNLLSHNFFRRAFAVWGHYFVAQLIIGLIIFFIYLALFVVIMGNSVNLFVEFIKLMKNILRGTQSCLKKSNIL